MPVGDRLILLSQQLKSKKPKQCERCQLMYDSNLNICPHCTGLSDREVEELQINNKKIRRANITHLIQLLIGLFILLAMALWIL